LKERCFFEQGEAEDLQNSVEVGVDPVPLPDDGDEHIDGHGDPDLRLDRVLGGAEEGLDSKVLLDPLEADLSTGRE